MDLLKELTETPSVPGREDRIRALIEERTDGLFDETRVDVMGSLIGIRKPRPAAGKGRSRRTPTRVMLAAHMDQIGFLVKHVDSNGFLRVNPVGGFDTRNLFARLVNVAAKGGDLPGVLNPGGKPIHVASEEERKKVPEVSEFVIDLGLPAAQVSRKVSIGDMVTMRTQFERVGGSVVSQCLDNRVGCWALIRALQKLKKHDCEIYCVWTVQEEVGLRGAGPAAFGIEPDIAISCDTTLCCDTPGVPEDQHINTMGNGVALKVMDSSMITDIKLLEELEAIARKKRIKHQRSILPRGGQDGGAIQRSRYGVRTGVLACPVRYIHTVTEMAAESDIKSYRDLLAAFLEQA